jgi:hypothetical protein
VSKSERRAERRRSKRAKHAKKRAEKRRAEAQQAAKKQQAAPALFEELEPRILYSTLTGMDSDPSLLDADYAVGGEVLEADAALDADEASRDVAAESLRHELVFVDTGVEGYQQLVDDLRAASPEGRQLEVILLDSEQDGIEQISDFLKDYEDLDAIHIVSHGSEGAAQLGNAWLTNDSLSTYEDAIESWGTALSEEADLLFYGCDLAGGESGEALVGSIAKLTGADVAASDDLTGAAVLGGDWELEVATGRVETSLLIDGGAAQTWTGTLAVAADDFSSGDFAGGSGWSGDWIEVDASGVGAGAGKVVVAGGEVRLRGTPDSPDGPSVAREIDLSTAGTATLSFDFRTGTGVEAFEDSVVAEVSNDGGSSWSVLETFDGYAGAVSGSRAFDISGFAAVDTQIRFRVAAAYGGPDEFFYVDNVQVTYGDVLAAPNTGSAIWAENGSGVPETSAWDGTDFGAEGTTASVGTWRTMQGAEAPTRDEKIVVGVEEGGTSTGMMWNGSSWSALSLGTLGTVSETYWYGSDVAYESQSGDAVLVWNDSSEAAGDELRFSVWDGSSWTTPASIAAYTGAEPQNIRLASSPSSDEMVLVVSDGSANDYVGHGRERPVGDRGGLREPVGSGHGRLRQERRPERVSPHLERQQLGAGSGDCRAGGRYGPDQLDQPGLGSQLGSHRTQRAHLRRNERRRLVRHLERERLGNARPCGNGRDRFDLPECRHRLRSRVRPGAGRVRPERRARGALSDLGHGRRMVFRAGRAELGGHSQLDDAGLRSQLEPHHAVRPGQRRRPEHGALGRHFLRRRHGARDGYRGDEESAVRVPVGSRLRHPRQSNELPVDDNGAGRGIAQRCEWSG